MKIYTKTGDNGSTSLIGGNRVPKHHLRIECYGTLDELNSYIGLISSQKSSIDYRDTLQQIQSTLFIIGSHLAADNTKFKLPKIPSNCVSLLEQSIDILENNLPELNHFILPGGSQTSSFCHLARCVCRRAERHIVLLSENATIDSLVLAYVNRLSDYFFTLSRAIAIKDGVEEIKWKPLL